MDKFVIKGGRRLEGEVTISGAKNAAVAILPAVILSDEPCIVENVPTISDVTISLRILEEMGAQVTSVGKDAYRIDPISSAHCSESSTKPAYQCPADVLSATVL